MYLLGPFLASIIYVFGALWLKRAGSFGADTWLIALANNCFSAICFVLIGFALNDSTGQGVWWQATLTGGSFVAGQTLAFAAFKFGDVSIATPVLGLKIILVAVFTILMLGDYGSIGIWLGAVLATLGIFFLSKNDQGAAKQFWITVLLSFLGAAGYALFDVTLQKWAPLWGVQNYLMWSFIWVAILTQFFWLFTKRVEGGLGRGWKYLKLGVLAITVQSMIISLVISYEGHATAVNVVYSLRGMWSVLMVFFLGHWFDNKESDVSKKVFVYRCVGVLMMTVGVVLVFI